MRGLLSSSVPLPDAWTQLSARPVCPPPSRVTLSQPLNFTGWLSEVTEKINEVAQGRAEEELEESVG